MHAQVVIAQAKPDQLDAAMLVYKDHVLPAVVGLGGYRGSFLLVDRQKHKLITVTLWDGANQGHETVSATAYDHVLAGSLTQEVYAVQAEDGTDHLPREGVVARASYGSAQPGVLDEAARVFREDVLPASQAQDGFVGALFMSAADTHKLMGITLWASDAALHQGEHNDYYTQQVTRLGKVVAGPITREHFEVLTYN